MSAEQGPRWVRLEGSVVVEVVVPPASLDIVEMFHPALLELLAPTGPEVEPGWRLVDGMWEPPA